MGFCISSDPFVSFSIIVAVSVSDADESSTHETATETETATIMENDTNGSDEMQKTVLELQTETKDRSFEVYTKEVVKHRGGSWIRNTEPYQRVGQSSVITVVFHFTFTKIQESSRGPDHIILVVHRLKTIKFHWQPFHA